MSTTTRQKETKKFLSKPPILGVHRRLYRAEQNPESSGVTDDMTGEYSRGSQRPAPQACSLLTLPGGLPLLSCCCCC